MRRSAGPFLAMIEACYILDALAKRTRQYAGDASERAVFPRNPPTAIVRLARSSTNVLPRTAVSSRATLMTEVPVSPHWPGKIT